MHWQTEIYNCMYFFLNSSKENSWSIFLSMKLMHNAKHMNQWKYTNVIHVSIKLSFR